MEYIFLNEEVQAEMLRERNRLTAHLSQNMGKTTIELQSLEFRYFKGYRDFKIDFANDVTNISGDNETGKTTIKDGFIWLFFGIDSEGRSDTSFSIKTIDKSTGKIIPRVDHSVAGKFLLNGEVTTAKRVLKEKWTKKKGALEKVYTGNETEYYWNEVPLAQREYQAKISEFISIDTFKLITDPYAFNLLHWEKQRKILTELEGNVSDTSIAKGNKAFENLMSKLVNKSFEDYKKQTKGTLKKLKEDKQGIPSRIDELLRDKPESIDYAKIEKEIEKEQKALSKIDDEIADVNKSAEKLHAKYADLRKEKVELVSSNQDIEFGAKEEANHTISQHKDPTTEVSSSLNEAESELQSYENAIVKLKGSLNADKTELETVKAKRKAKSDEWDAINSQELKFKEGELNCPACKRPLETTDQDAQKAKMEADFIKKKSDELEAINKVGFAIKNQQTSLEDAIAKYEIRIKDGSEKLSAKKKEVESLNSELGKLNKNKVAAPNKDKLIEKALALHKTYNTNLEQIAKIEKQLENQEEVDVDNLKEHRNSILSEIETLKNSLSDKAKIEKIDNRIAELEKEEKENSQQIADAERELYTIQEFEIARMTSTEGAINAKFGQVKFDMFSTLVDGTQVPACICTFKGIPFHSVNTAGKIQAGLDIINTLCGFYDTFASIFIDGAESITNIPETESQQIRLIVEKGVNPLIVE